MKSLFKQLPQTVSAIARSVSISTVDFNSCSFGGALEDVLTQLSDEARKSDAYCVPMFCHYRLLDAHGDVLYTSESEKLGEDLPPYVSLKEIHSKRSAPYPVTRQLWQIDIDPEKIIPEHLRSDVRKIQVFGRSAVDLESLHYHTRCTSCALTHDGCFYKVLINPRESIDTVLLKSIDVPEQKSLDAQLDSALTVDSDLKPVSLGDTQIHTLVAEDNHISDFESDKLRDITDCCVDTKTVTAEFQRLLSYINFMELFFLTDSDTLPYAIGRVTDKKTLRRLRRADRLSCRQEKSDRTDTLIIPPGKFRCDVSPETRDFYTGTDDRDPFLEDIRHKPWLTVPLKRRIGKMSESAVTYKKSLHCLSTYKSEIQHPQSVIHHSEMRVNRRIGDDHPVAHPYSVRREIPYTLDAGRNHCIGYVLSALDRNRHYAYPYIHLPHQFLQFVKMIDRYTSDFSPDNFFVDVHPGYDIKTVALKPRIRDQCCSEAA